MPGGLGGYNIGGPKTPQQPSWQGEGPYGLAGVAQTGAINNATGQSNTYGMGGPQNPTTPVNPGAPGNPGTVPPSPGGPGYQPYPFQPLVPNAPPVNEPQVPGGPQTGTTQFGSGLEGTIGNLLNTAGTVNQNVINSQTDQARGAFDQQRKAQLSQDEAQLADRGLMGSGAEAGAMGQLDKNLGQQYGSALSGIYGNEYQAANQRMMSALTTGAGMSEQDAARAIEGYNAQTGRAGTLGELGLQGQAIGTQSQLGNKGLDIQKELGEGALTNQSQLGNKGLDIQSTLGSGDLALRKLLGEGQLGLGEQGLNEDYSKFLGSLGLSRDALAQQITNGDFSNLNQLLGLLNQGGNTTAGGYF